MLTERFSQLIVEQKAIASQYLKRYVIIDLYLPVNIGSPTDLKLLLVNDGQDLPDMNYGKMLNDLMASGQVGPTVSVGIHANKERKNEYGTAGIPDYAGRGNKATAYNQFILEELLPFIHTHYAIEGFQKKSFCGFSLGGLSALDIVWNNPDVFAVCGVVSGSLWWRSKSLEDDYNDDTDRIMHQVIKKGKYKPGLKFYFVTGSLDETADRNNNGIIDSIDDTLALMKDLENLGYEKEHIRYVNFEDGRHDVETWGRAMPGFLLWMDGR
jgi:iron(III)-enterobactin esterase